MEFEGIGGSAMALSQQPLALSRRRSCQLSALERSRFPRCRVVSFAEWVEAPLLLRGLARTTGPANAVCDLRSILGVALCPER